MAVSDVTDVDKLDSKGLAGLLLGLEDGTMAALTQLVESLVQHIQAPAGTRQDEGAAVRCWSTELRGVLEATPEQLLQQGQVSGTLSIRLVN